MAQVIHVNSMSVPISMEKKIYAVNIKGLIAHLLDILFAASESEKAYDSSDLSIHLQRDIGIRR